MKTIFAILSVFLSVQAMACSSLSHPTDAKLFGGAKAVFRARVTEARLAKFANPSNPSDVVEVVEAKYEIREVYKGTPLASGVVRDLPFGPGNCSLGLMPGMEYVFYPDKNDMVLILSGSFGYFNADGAEVKPKLEALRTLSESK